MASDAACDDADAVGDFFGRLDTAVLDFSACAHDATAFGETELGVDFSEMFAHHKLDAELHGSFFAGLGQENHVAVERQLAAFQKQHRHERSGDVVLIVHGAAAVDVAVGACGGKRRMFPLLGVDVDDIGVAHEEERALRAVAADASDEVGPIGVDGEDFRLDPFGFEDAFEIVHRGPFASGRVAGVEAQEILKMFKRFFVDGFPIRRHDGFGGPALEGEEDEAEGKAAAQKS